MQAVEITPVPCKHCSCTAVAPSHFNESSFMACECPACGMHGPFRPILRLLDNRPLQRLCIQDWNNLFSTPPAERPDPGHANGETSGDPGGSGSPEHTKNTPAKAPTETAASQPCSTSRAEEMAVSPDGWPEGRKMPVPGTQQALDSADGGADEGAGLGDDPEGAKHSEETQRLRAEVKAWLVEHHITAKAGAGYIGISAERMYRFLNGSRWVTPQTLQSIRTGFTRALANGIEKKAQPEEEPDPANRNAFVRFHLVRWMESMGYSLDEAAMHLWMNNAEVQDLVDGKPVDDEILPRLCAAIRPLRIHAEQLGTGKGINGSGTG